MTRRWIALMFGTAAAAAAAAEVASGAADW